MRQWEPAVESIWSDKCNLLINGRLLPLRLDLRFDSATPHHTVIVRNNAVSRVDQLNWSRYSSARVIAHEIGHMLGAYDEYPGGAQNPDAERVDPQSIMGGSPGVTPDVAAHHFELIESWVQGFTQDARITTVTTGS